jgi:hypothetical protein
MLLSVSAAVPVFFSVTACAELVVPTVWLANVKLAGDNPTAGAKPVPLNPTERLGLVALL